MKQPVLFRTGSYFESLAERHSLKQHAFGILREAFFFSIYSYPASLLAL